MSLPELNPSARFQATWVERIERNFNRSAPELVAQVGIFPKFREDLNGGLQISTDSTFSGTSPNSFELSNGFTNKSISLHQVFLESHLGTELKWSGLIGKFRAPTLYSPLTWSDELTPEGLFQSLEFASAGLGIYAAQYSIDQASPSISAGTPLRRSWLFHQGFFGHYLLGLDTEFNFSLNHYFFHDLSERLANEAGQRGNSYLGTIDTNASFQYKYSPVEIVVTTQAKPLGILTGIKGAFAINLRTPDKQRSFFAEGFLGNTWRPRNFSFSLSFYYNEPDASLSLLADHQFGYGNRKAGRGEISYFFLQNLRLGISALYADVLQPNLFQAHRKEIRSNVEFLF